MFQKCLLNQKTKKSSIQFAVYEEAGLIKKLTTDNFNAIESHDRETLLQILDDMFFDGLHSGDKSLKDKSSEGFLSNLRLGPEVRWSVESISIKLIEADPNEFGDRLGLILQEKDTGI